TAAATEAVDISDARRGKLAPGEKALIASPGTWFVWAGIAAFFIFLAGIVISVLVDSFGRQWFTTWLPDGWTTQWYGEAWSRFDLGHIIGVTVLVAGTVVAGSILIGLPASYVLARSR